MKKFAYFALILVLIAGVSMFGAWSPIPVETEVRYANAPIISPIASEDIYYTSREVLGERDTAGGAPTFNTNEGYSNVCGPLAGTGIVAFYDKYYPNLIPGWDSYYPATGKYRPQGSVYISAVLSELYTLMQTNVKGDGVSESEFKTGLQTYINNQGYSVNYESVMNGGTFNYNAFTNAVDNNKVTVLFIRPSDICDISEYSDHDLIVSYNITGNHIMYAFGYFQVKYYNGSTLIRTDTYLKVATVRMAPDVAYYRLETSSIEAAYIVNVA